MEINTLELSRLIIYVDFYSSYLNESYTLNENSRTPAPMQLSNI